MTICVHCKGSLKNIINLKEIPLEKYQFAKNGNCFNLKK